jgi:hypothetical protein
MNSTNGYYSIIRYCPDPSRQEFVNIGVAIYSPITKLVRTAFGSDNRRLGQMFPGQDLRLVNRMKRAIEENLCRQSFASAPDFEAFIARNANQVQLSSLRSIKLTEAADEMSSLLTRLVEEAGERRPRVQRALRQKLVEAGVENLVHKHVTVTVPAFEQSIRVPYGYRNGRYNLITPVEFSADVRDIFSKAGEKAIEGQELYRTPDPSLGDLHLVVVAKFDPAMQIHARERVEQIFQQHNVEMHSLDNLGRLVDEIKSAATEHGLINRSS